MLNIISTHSTISGSNYLLPTSKLTLVRLHKFFFPSYKLLLTSAASKYISTWWRDDYKIHVFVPKNTGHDQEHDIRAGP